MKLLPLNIFIVGIAICAIVISTYYCIDGFVSNLPGAVSQDYLDNQRGGNLPTDPTCPRGQYGTGYTKTPDGFLISGRTICSGPAVTEDPTRVNAYDPLAGARPEPAYRALERALRIEEAVRNREDPLSSNTLSYNSLLNLQDGGTSYAPPPIFTTLSGLPTDSNSGSTTLSSGSTSGVTSGSTSLATPTSVVTPTTTVTSTSAVTPTSAVTGLTGLSELTSTLPLSSGVSSGSSVGSGLKGYSTTRKPSNCCSSYKRSNDDTCDSNEDDEMCDAVCEGFASTIQPVIAQSPSQIQGNKLARANPQLRESIISEKPRNSISNVIPVNIQSALRQPAQRQVTQAAIDKALLKAEAKL